MVFDFFNPLNSVIVSGLLFSLIGGLIGIYGRSFAMAIFGSFTMFIYIALTANISFLREIVYLTVFVVLLVVAFRIVDFGLSSRGDSVE